MQQLGIIAAHAARFQALAPPAHHSFQEPAEAEYNAQKIDAAIEAALERFSENAPPAPDTDLLAETEARAARAQRKQRMSAYRQRRDQHTRTRQL